MLLSGLEGWNEVTQGAFGKVKRGLLDAITLAAYDPELQTCIFTDACDEFWGLLITQCNPGDHLKPWEEQAGKHRPLAVESGRFRHAQLRSFHVPDVASSTQSSPEAQLSG